MRLKDEAVLLHNLLEVETRVRSIRSVVLLAILNGIEITALLEGIHVGFPGERLLKVPSLRVLVRELEQTGWALMPSMV